MFSTNSRDADHQPITLDFTEHEPVVIGKSIKRQLLITNHTAITAPFTVEAEYFTGYCPSQLDENSERYSTSCILILLYCFCINTKYYLQKIINF